MRAEVYTADTWNLYERCESEYDRNDHEENRDSQLVCRPSFILPSFYQCSFGWIEKTYYKSNLELCGKVVYWDPKKVQIIWPSERALWKCVWKNYHFHRFDIIVCFNFFLNVFRGFLRLLQCRVIWCRITCVYSHSVSSFCVELSSCRVGGCRVGLYPKNSDSYLMNVL